MSVNWPATLRRASYRGVPFFVESDDLSGGHRLVIHEFPNRNDPYIENLGRRAENIYVTAYLASDNVLAQQRALVAACRQLSPSTLVLPTEGPKRVHCQTWSRTHERDRMGYIAFSLEFVVDGAGVGPYPVALLERLVSVATDALGVQLKSSFLRAFSTLGLPAWVLDEAMAQVFAFAELADSVRLQMRMGPRLAGKAANLIALLHSEARKLSLDGGERPGAPSQTFFGAAIPSGNGGALVSRSIEVVTTLRQAAVSPQEAYELMLPLADIGIATTAPKPLSVTATQSQANVAVVNSMFRSAALSQIAIAAAEAEYTSAPDAIRARADISELLDREMHGVTQDGSLYQALTDVRGKAVAAISKKIADQVPVVTVDTQASLPSVVLAHQLYGDAGRFRELVERNDVAHPSHMPTTFEALVS